jgi:hypothetical protein
MNTTKKEPSPNQPARSFWWSGGVFLSISVINIWRGLRGEVVVLHRFGAPRSCPSATLDPWQSICVGIMLLFMGIWSLKIAIQRTRLKKNNNAEQSGGKVRS